MHSYIETDQKSTRILENKHRNQVSICMKNTCKILKEKTQFSFLI